MRTTLLFEDKHIIVAYKPAGLATQTARVGQPDMVSELKNHIGNPRLGVIHRLDQPVEGVLVFGKTGAAAADLSRQLTRGILNKRYYAVVCGEIAGTEGMLVDFLRKTPDNRAEVVTAAGQSENTSSRRGGAQKAVLQYRIVESGGNIHLLDIQIETGRFHQIRAQLANAGMPILGDAKYGNDFSRELSSSLSVKNVALCACELQFVHPSTGKPMCFHVEPQGGIFRRFSKWC